MLVHYMHGYGVLEKAEGGTEYGLWEDGDNIGAIFKHRCYILKNRCYT